jgi:bifunctional DNA-binding transcriptional regulator/antitoxin component of YhaV-PrlF toxin-antitoxin module
MTANMQTLITVSGRGLISLPIELRKAAGIRPQDTLIAQTTPEGILLRTAVTLPLEIYTPERVTEFDAAEAELASVLRKRREG